MTERGPDPRPRVPCDADRGRSGRARVEPGGARAGEAWLRTALGRALAR